MKAPITKIKETDEKYDFADVKSSKHTRNRARTHKRFCVQLNTFSPELVDEDNPDIGYF